MSKGSDYWSSFWSDKDDPLHSASDDAYFDRLGYELRMILPDSFGSVLEVGCGNGALYERLGFNECSYLGIDYSPKMVEVFSRDFPGADVAVKDLRDMESANAYDLIFSHGVLQFIPFRDFEKQMAASVKMLQPGGAIVHGGVLWDVVRPSVYSGAFLANAGNQMKNLVRYAAVRAGLIRSMGYWYSIPEMKKLAHSFGLEAHFTGSVLNPYRFHAIFKKPV